MKSLDYEPLNRILSLFFFHINSEESKFYLNYIHPFTTSQTFLEVVFLSVLDVLKRYVKYSLFKDCVHLNCASF